MYFISEGYRRPTPSLFPHDVKTAGKSLLGINYRQKYAAICSGMEFHMPGIALP